MTVMPADAPRSEDGRWWWDGAQWQPVAEPAAGAQQAQAASAAAPSQAVGQVSEDGQWQWDGTQWQPAWAATATSAGADTSGASTAPAGGPQITLGVPTAEASHTSDGTTAVIVKYSVTNSGTTAIEAGTLLIGFYVGSASGAAENAAYVSGDLLIALAPGEEHHGQWPIQVDPGSWTVWVVISDQQGGDLLASSENVAVEVAGHRAVAHDFDDTQTYSLTVTITSVEHVQGGLYRVHYDVQSDRDVPVGLHVSGSLGADASQSGQVYDLTTTIAAGRPHPHYLTLEALVPSRSTATIYVDPSGPSETKDSVVVDIAEDGTPTMSR